MDDHTTTQDARIKRLGIAGPHQFAEHLLAGVLVAIRELTEVIRQLAEAQEAQSQTRARW